MRSIHHLNHHVPYLGSIYLGSYLDPTYHLLSGESYSLSGNSYHLPDLGIHHLVPYLETNHIPDLGIHHISDLECVIIIIPIWEIPIRYPIWALYPITHIPLI